MRSNLLFSLLLFSLLLIGSCVNQVPDGPRVQLWTCDASNWRQQFALHGEDNSIRPVYEENIFCLTYGACQGGWWCDSKLWIYYCNSRVRFVSRSEQTQFLQSSQGRNEPLPTALPNQQWKFSKEMQLSLFNQTLCASVPSLEPGSLLTLENCSTNGYKFQFDSKTGLIKSRDKPNLCLDFGTFTTCAEQPIKDLPFCNGLLPVSERVNDLVARMTLDEKMQQMIYISYPIARLGIPYFNYWSEGLHGVSARTTVTSFPQVIGVGASFNQSMFHTIGQVTSTEGRAKAAKLLYGLTYWSPNINIYRDPRWGRGHETPGEDPYLSGRYAVGYVTGMQRGTDYKCTKVVATCKHYAAYSLENSEGVERYAFNAIVDDRDLVETYLPAFKACVMEGGARSVMCSYNAVNGVPACANPFLLNTVLRESWNFDGYVVSDCDAVSDIYHNHHYTNTSWDATAAAVKAGCDLDCGQFYTNLPEALAHKALSEEDVTRAVTRMFTQRFELGLFDSTCSYSDIPPSAVDTPQHRLLSLQASRESIVLLKNDKKMLPLDLHSPTLRKIAVIGPNANDSETLLGDYFGQPPFIITPLQGIQMLAGKTHIVRYSKGCQVTGNDKSKIAEAVQLAKESNIAIIFVGLNQDVESESTDRKSLELPGVQMELVKQVFETGVPTIVVLINGGPIAIEWIMDRVPAIVEAWYPGQSGGQAIAEVLFGLYNPAGRLPVTVYPGDYIQKIKMTDMSMRVYPGRTYRYLQIEPLYPFGYGLSYTTFKVESADQQENEMIVHSPMQSFTVRYNVTNTGNVVGDYVVLVFVDFQKFNPSSDLKRQLFGFKRLGQVKPGETRQVFFSVTPSVFARGMNALTSVVEAGRYSISVDTNAQAESVVRVTQTMELRTKSS